MIKLTTTETEETTWAHIQMAVDNGNADIYQEGQIVTDVLKDGREMQFAIAAINHYEEDEIIFVNKISYGDHCMNKNGKNKGGWKDSDMRRYANEEIFNLLSDELQAVIAPRTIVERDRNGNETTCEDKLWGLSIKEISGDWYNAADNGEDEQFPYFEDSRNRILLDKDGQPDIWWERSPNLYNTYYFYFVSTSGLPGGSSSAYFASGVCFGFIIRKSK